MDEVDEKNFCHYYGISFKRTILKLLDHSYAKSSFTTFERHLTVEDFMGMGQHRT